MDDETDLVFRSHLRDKRANAVMAAAGLVLVAIVGINLLPADGGDGESSPILSPVPSSSSAATTARSPSPSVLAATTSPRPDDPIDAGNYDIAWPEMRLRLTMPPGWSSTGHGTTIRKPPGDLNTATLSLTANPPMWVGVDGPARVATDVCPTGEKATFVEVGPTVDDLTTALANQVGVERSGPTEVMVGGHPAKRFVLTGLRCSGGPEGRLIWRSSSDSDSSAFGLLFGGTATINVVDVNGDRLVIASHQRGASEADVAELDAIIASIEIEPASAGVHPMNGDLSIGRHALAVDGTPFSFTVPASGWEPHDGMSINKSVVEGQSAEAVIYWTSAPVGTSADPCANLPGLPVGRSIFDLVAAVKTAPGTELATGPLTVTVGGRMAKYLTLTVREDSGCHPGFLYRWDETYGGAFWGDARPETVRVWIVQLDSTLLFIGSVEKKNSIPRVGYEIQQIVDSIVFE